LRKLNPRAEKTVSNEAFADRFGKKKTKSIKRKERHARVVVRETAYLVALGVDPKESEAPVA
jgi:hypothetical protein